MVRNLPRAFFCAVCAALVYEVFGLKDTFALFSESDNRVLGFIPFDLLLCVLLGLVCGLLGALFVYIISRICAVRNRYVGVGVGGVGVFLCVVCVFCWLVG
jgi:H+/Cl- antiporter ClcA